MLTVYTTQNKEQWDNIVCSFENYDTYWLCGYVKAFEVHGDGDALLFYYEDDSSRGINVAMKRDISEDSRFGSVIEKGKYFDLATPYGYGGWLIEGVNTDILFSEYEKWCFENNIISEFVRFHPVIKNHLQASSYEIIGLGNTVSLDLSSPETIWANITSKNRNVIRKAQKNSIHIYNGRYPEIYQKFREIYNATMDKDNADSYYYFSPEFYESICHDLAYNAQVFYAEMEGKIIAASIMLSANGFMNYHLSGSVREYSNLAPTNLLLYEAALWGYANGYKSLYLGGGVGSGEDSLFKFKKSFYRLDDLPRFYIGKKIFNKELYEYLVSLRTDLPDNEFFPEYRA